jgi:hypothetical protein
MGDPVAEVVEAFHPIGDAPSPLGLQVRERVPQCRCPQCLLVPGGEQVSPEAEGQLRHHPPRRHRLPVATYSTLGIGDLLPSPPLE